MGVCVHTVWAFTRTGVWVYGCMGVMGLCVCGSVASVCVHVDVVYVCVHVDVVCVCIENVFLF